MIHIRKIVRRSALKKVYIAKCGAKLTFDDFLVETALASDCDPCRGLAGVGGKNEKTWDGKLLGVRSEPVFDPNTEPLRDANGKIYEREKP